MMRDHDGSIGSTANGEPLSQLGSGGRAPREGRGLIPWDALLSRRRFLEATAVGAAGILGARDLLVPAPTRAEGRSTRVVRTYHAGATTGWTTVNQEPVDQMVHAAIRALTGIGVTAWAWKSLFPGITAAHKVGLKINLSCGDVPTHPQIVNAIVDGLLMMDLDGATLPAENIIVWDMDNAFFCPQTGYAVNFGGPGVQYFGTDHAGVGFDTSRSFVIQHPHGSTTTHHPSRILSQMIDYMINVAVIKDHSDAGTTLCLKNNYGSFDNVWVNQMHRHWYYGDGHTRGEPELNRVMRDELGDKTKLFVVDATFGLYTGGPGYTPPGHTPPNWRYNSLLMGLDPVAVDTIGTAKINEERTRNGLAALDPSHIHAAAQPPYSLGTDELAQIELLEVDAALAADVDPVAAGPSELTLAPPSPNPARGSCNLRFHNSEACEVEILVADAGGSVVRRWGHAPYGPGSPAHAG
ncbi:MAG: DUF362 domain-containing protein, partial [Ignavibacteriaceae bacterium]|nr:DUF362 domain-containing protein [Ignavibacteriaceae bacterium]